MIIFAHRGASAQCVQNTLSAFELARQQGATCYELDVHRLADGQLAVHHDDSLLSTAGVDIKLKDLTAIDLHNYPLQNPFTQEQVFVPLLSDVLPVITPHLQLLNIELKNDDNIYPDLEKDVWDFVQKYPQLLDKILFSSFDYSTLQRLRTYATKARIGWLTRTFDLAKAQDLGAESVHINHTRLTPAIVDTCHTHHLKVFVYTVNEIAVANRLKQINVDGIFTDKPDLFL